MTYKAIIAGAVVVLAGAAGFGYLANTISTSFSRTDTAAVTALRSQLQFWETDANQEAGELHDLNCK